MKRFLAVTLALVMVLSIGSMAAFAEEACNHPGRQFSQETDYTSLGSLSHRKEVYDVTSCTTCSNTERTLVSSVIESHVFSRYVFLYDDTESGETTYYYAAYCVCGRRGPNKVSDCPLHNV